MESQRLLPPREAQVEDESFEGDWSDRSSYSTYSNSDSDSIIPDWEPNVDDYSGELLYIDCHPFVTHNRYQNKPNEAPEAFSKSQLRRSTRGKFLRLLRKRDSKRIKKSQKSVEEGIEANTQKVKFQDFQEGEQREVTLEIDHENRYNLSSDKSLAESLLGLIVSTLSDGNRVMIAGFSYDSKAKHDRNIKIGDWLKTINNMDVNVQNLDDILQKFINHNEVLLTLQRVGATEVTKDPPINELNLESAFVRDLLNSKVEENHLVLQKLCGYPVGLVYINTEKLDENNKANEDLIYCFPKPNQKNLLANSRGMFITLSHLLQDITKTTSRVSSMLYKEKLAHVVYTKFGQNLLLFMLPDERASVKEALLMNSELLRFLEFSFDSLDRCFTHMEQTDRLLFRYFARIICNSDWATTEQFMEYQFDQESPNSPNNCAFEQIMPVVPTLKLHDDAITQINDALSELEASDYREWNEEALDCQRLFTILGSALFHAGYLLHSHMMYDDLVDVYNFCKYQGLVHLSKTEPVKSLVLWREVFPRSCKRELIGNVNIPEGRRYLLVVGTGKDFLAVIMEAGGATEPPEENMGPDAFYVEEAQATLAHIQELGLSIVAERFLMANGGFQIATPMAPMNKKKSDFIDLRKRLNFLTSVNVTRAASLTPKARKLYRVANNLKTIARNLNKEYANAQTRLARASDFVNSEDFIKSTVNPTTYKFIMSQLRFQKSKTRARRFSNEDKVFALSLIRSSTRNYRLLQKVFALPSPQTLRNLLRKVPLKCGINDKLMLSLQHAVAKMAEEDKLCSLLFDEISLSPGLSYNIKHDYIEGFEDLGNGQRSSKFADHALVFMVRGIRRKWKQPLAFYYVESGMKTPALIRNLKDIIKAAQNSGLHIMATVCDQLSTNKAAINELIRQTNETYIRKGTENRNFGFEIENKEIIPFYDPPHLLKGIRNNMLQKDVKFHWKKGFEQTASWNVFVKAYERDCPTDPDFRIFYGLTDAHIYEDKMKKMKVNLAAQVLSQRVASSINFIVRIGSLGFTKSAAAPQAHGKESTSGAKKNEVISILKRRSSEQNVLNASHEDSYDAYSEGSESQSFSEALSEISDESSNRNRKVKYDSNEEDSDFDDYGEGSQISSSSCDLSEIRQSLLSDLGEYSSSQLTSGRYNVLYHFVHLDPAEGMLVTPLECDLQSQTYQLILNNFRRCCQNIHDIFQSTLRFKSLPAQDIAKSLMNKSLIAIKEYGMLFECLIDDKDGNRKAKMAYWVIGRLFYTPHPKELYICYQDTVPQNLVELAFKINLNSII